DALALGALAWRMFGGRYGLAAVAIAASNRFLAGLGATLHLGGTETLFLLLTLLAWSEARRRPSWRLGGAAGASLALAFLTKEAALLWLPLPVLALLLDGRAATRGDARMLAAFYAAFAVLAGWWWPYVWLVDRRVYMWSGSPLTAVAFALAGLLALAALFTALGLVARAVPSRLSICMRALGAALAAAWIGAFVVVMETTSWPFPKDFLHTVPAYLRDVVAGNVAPWPLAAAAVCLLVARAPGDERYRLLALGFALWLPFATFAANRGFALRDLLPMVYFAYLVAAVVAVDLASWLISQVEGAPSGIAAAVVLTVAAGYFGLQGVAAVRDHRADPPAASADWNNTLVRETASWIAANVPAGTPVVSSRLYFSQLYVLTGARYPVAQLPTVNVVPHPGREPYLRPRSTLFRWEDRLLRPTDAPNDWISVDRYPAKRYYTALSQQDLVDQIAHRRADYLVLAGDDVAFSSTRYVDYFTANPAFTLMHAAELAGAGRVYVFRVDRARLALRPYATSVPASVLNRLYQSARGAMPAEALLRAINPAGLSVQPDETLDPALASALPSAGAR